MMLSLFVGRTLSDYITAFMAFSYLEPSVLVRGQDENNRCGKSRVGFLREYGTIVDNPLCDYSNDLHEIPTIEYDEIAANPYRFDNRIIRVKGRFEIGNNATGLKNSKLFMESNSSGEEYPIHFNSPWDKLIVSKIRESIDSSLYSNSAEVTLIIELLEVSNNTAAMEISGGNPFHMLVLHV
jgi:hypothetical protein